MIKLIKDNDKYRLVNTEKVFINDKNNIIFTSKDIKFSYTDDIRMVGEFNNSHEMVYLLRDGYDDNDYIPIIDMKITKSLFEFIKDELENITENYGNILEYEIIEDNKIVNSTELNSNTIKEEVLKVEFDRVFDKWGMRVIYQNFDILERSRFKDEDIKVVSSYSIQYDSDDNMLYILGDSEEEDNKIIIVNDEDKKIIEHKVKLINEKYGIEKRWRAEENKTYYFILVSNFYIDDDYDIRDKIDDERYEMGNYFKTKELAEKKLNEIKELLLK